MLSLKPITFLVTLLGAAGITAGRAGGADIRGTISSTLVITEHSQLVDDIICSVVGAPCIAIGAPNVTLELNGFTMTGQADAQLACNGGPATFPPEDGINVSGQSGVTINGPGLIQRFRGAGVYIRAGSNAATVRGITIATNCASGILVGGGAGHDISENVSIRNGHGGFPCGGI